MKNFKILCLMAIIGLFLLMGGCQKEEDVTSPVIDREITKEEIIDFCDNISHKNTSFRSRHRTPLNVLPDFSTLVKSTNQSGHSVYIGYLDKYSLDSIIKPTQDKGALIAFFKDSIGDIRSELMLWDQKPGSYFDQSYFLIYPQSKFTGITLLINDYDRVEKIGAYKNGLLTKFQNLTIQISGTSVYDFKHLTPRCNCDDGCYLSIWCSIYCGVLAVVHEGGSFISDIGNWFSDGLKDIYYWWADGEWKDSSWFGDPGPGNSGFSGGTWGGTWGSNDGDHGGWSNSGGIGSWHIEQIKCRTQIFNDMEGNGDVVDLEYPDLCTLHNLLNLNDCAYQYLYEDPALVAEISNFLASKSNSDKAKELVNEYLKALCLSDGNGKRWNLNEMNTLYCIHTQSVTGTDKVSLLDFYQNSTLINPCTGDEIDKDGIFNNLCGKGNLSMEGLDTALDGVDAIIKDPTFKNCKALNCIYEKLYNSGSKMFCNNIYRFNYSDKIDLTIRVGTTYGNAEGTVTMSNNGEGVVMTFANFNCNWDDHIQLAETLLHESVHAKFRFDHANNGTSESEFKTNFLKYVNEKYGIPYTEHQLMIKNYMEKLAEELRILNDNKYDTSYYMAWVWESLKRDWPNLFNESTVKGWNDKRDIVKMNNPFKC